MEERVKLWGEVRTRTAGSVPSNSHFGFYRSMAEWVGRVAPSRADWISFRIVKKAAIGARRSDAPYQP